MGVKSLKVLADEGNIDEFFDKFALFCEQNVLTVVGRCEGYDETAKEGEVAFEALKKTCHSLVEQGVDSSFAITAVMTLINGYAFGEFMTVIGAGVKKAERVQGGQSED
ncbi:MAG: hypothetical protein A3C93_04825 [Candidatus Lloydbacteria bacterium RIFCSPHIGHO2_02_FULL_54_17]|uniref:Uncharacterized protein n=1 Tax=Candidatus Lloydbacteria bacterium RIFCSPHIGHO2_02_FULL_54_17 TaxID=1798664 RepID=A0A1G2DGA8_9BACT|nr:MAG: hypothetical protein A2762_01735 [Candidatus Lloydbacteria bacterium RIFCSPHIGHO2_01_FULL_54_11]OGZ12472.1 MAG: hypothetical protein A3C93_04825 [Candidatus Lloydbacteria bacterium RIFCSPHIGHO2_02_FULL_54_17]OGZ14730.1 MAG: hypothetical protein A2948_04505 [Candidatus Lloydbacteria bacterium RIFCSPLOWO2_01_FULL_54_18]OGZ15591.1 MAG: hypothetical protein A3H76_03960 [Candidatus Lloydbacteria bacterium RIFCSPLOWO2_02_FULL_54_12]